MLQSTDSEQNIYPSRPNIDLQYRTAFSTCLTAGSGKSLVYQLPAVIRSREGQVTVVVSPLIALIKDQIEHLQQLRITAESINSKMGEKDRKRVLDDLNCKVGTRH